MGKSFCRLRKGALCRNSTALTVNLKLVIAGVTSIILIKYS